MNTQEDFPLKKSIFPLALSTEFDSPTQQDPNLVLKFQDPQRNFLTEATAVEQKTSASISLKHQERYEVLQKLGEGGMGVVELVKDHYLGREVARKTLKFKMIPLKKQKKTQEMRLWRLKKEASITAILEHPNIIPLYEMQENEDSGELQFTMRKVEGETLRQVFQKARAKENNYNENKLLNIFRKVCDGVSYAHAKGVVHRDLKPENIMIGQFGEVYVMDWGIAKQLDFQTETSSENSIEQENKELQFQTIGGIGTLGYMAPEQQIEASGVTVQADIHALGKILKECFTQHSPLEEMQRWLDSLAIQQTRNKPYRKKVKPEKKVPEEIIAIERKATREKLEERYQNVQDLVDDLDRYQNNLRVSVKDYGFLELLKKWANRNKKELLLIGAITFLLLSVVFYYQWATYRQREEACTTLRL
ncbi:MAG: serine/threonine-protein kinase [Planctomycetota bacterium]